MCHTHILFVCIYTLPSLSPPSLSLSLSLSVSIRKSSLHQTQVSFSSFSLPLFFIHTHIHLCEYIYINIIFHWAFLAILYCNIYSCVVILDIDFVCVERALIVWICREIKERETKMKRCAYNNSSSNNSNAAYGCSGGSGGVVCPKPRRVRLLNLSKFVLAPLFF